MRVNINALNIEEEDVNEETQVLEIFQKAMYEKYQLQNVINESKRPVPKKNTGLFDLSTILKRILGTSSSVIS